MSETAKRAPQATLLRSSAMGSALKCSRGQYHAYTIQGRMNTGAVYDLSHNTLFPEAPIQPGMLLSNIQWFDIETASPYSYQDPSWDSYALEGYDWYLGGYHKFDKYLHGYKVPAQDPLPVYYESMLVSGPLSGTLIMWQDVVTSGYWSLMDSWPGQPAFPHATFVPYYVEPITLQVGEQLRLIPDVGDEGWINVDGVHEPCWMIVLNKSPSDFPW